MLLWEREIEPPVLADDSGVATSDTACAADASPRDSSARLIQAPRAHGIIPSVCCEAVRQQLDRIVWRRVVTMLVAVTSVGVVLYLLVVIPRYQIRGVHVDGEDASQKTAELINEYRKTLAQVIGGFFVVV